MLFSTKKQFRILLYKNIDKQKKHAQIQYGEFNQNTFKVINHKLYIMI